MFNFKQKITEFRRGLWRDEVLRNGRELKQWVSVRTSLQEAGAAPDTVVEFEISRLERRKSTLLDKLKETA